MNIKYIVELNEEEKKHLKELTSKGKHSARLLKRVYILLMAHKGKQPTEIAATLNVSQTTVCRTKKKVVESGLSEALSEGSGPACRASWMPTKKPC